jgi:hypothetical protein
MLELGGSFGCHLDVPKGLEVGVMSFHVLTSALRVFIPILPPFPNLSRDNLARFGEFDFPFLTGNLPRFSGFHPPQRCNVHVLTQQAADLGSVGTVPVN